MYLFLDLKHQELSDNKSTESIFLKSEEFLKSNNFIVYKDPIICLDYKLNDDTNYYVIHEHIILKGKIKILKGKIVTSNKKNLMDYFRTVIAGDDIRPLRIMSEQKEDFVITITDEGTALFFV